MFSIVPAAESDFPEIIRLAALCDLDTEEMSWEQFLVAREKNKIIGIGRLRAYADCIELATVGVEPDLRTKGVGAAIIKELISRGPDELWVTCVIPDYFRRFGFVPVKEYPPVLRKKVDFCISFNYGEDQIFVMKRTR